MRPFSRLQRRVRLHQLKLGRFLASHGASEYTILAIFSVLLGNVAGFAAVAFHKSIEFLTELVWHGEPGLHRPVYLVLLIPALGMFLQWLLSKRAARQARQKGVVEVIKAVAVRNGDIPLKTTLFHFFAPLISIVSGACVGPEAPTAQTGAGAVSAVSRFLGLSESRRRFFTAAGAGAAIAGVFNTPLAGVFFAVEAILLGNFQAAAIMALLLSSVSASIVSRIFLGTEPRFIYGIINAGPYSHYILFLLLGVLAGFVSVLFIRASEGANHWFGRYYRKHKKLPAMVAIGLLMGLAGLISPHVMGIGYSTINGILAGSFDPGHVSLFFILKFVMVIPILAAGGFGGLYAPSIFLGACFGYLFAVLSSHLFGIPLDPDTYALVGMGAMLTGINSVPVTAIMLLFEMTDNYHFILPLILGVVGSSLVSHLLLSGTIYQRELEHDGFRYKAGQDSRVLQSLFVEEVARLGISTVPENTPISEVVRQFLEDNKQTVYLVDEKNTITGFINAAMLGQLVSDYQHLRSVIIAKDVADPDVVFIDASANLEEAVRLFSLKRADECVVTIHGQRNQILGTIHYQDVMNAYHQNLLRTSVKDGLISDMKMIEADQITEVVSGFSIAEVSLPDSFIGKTVEQLRLRNKYKIDLLMVLRSKGPLNGEPEERERLMPHRKFVLQRGDKLMIYGRTLDVMLFARTKNPAKTQAK